MKTGIQYHDATSYHRHRMTGHYLDWPNQPAVFKAYPGIVPVLLPKDVELPEASFWSVLTGQGGGGLNREMDLGVLSRIFLLCYTLTAKARHPEGDFYFRSAASAGALYPTEIYIASNGVKGLKDGLYHFAPQHHGLAPLREQPIPTSLTAITGIPDTGAPVVSFILTAIYFRSAWKYRARAYRYNLLDTGHVLENLALALKILSVSFHLTYDFDDQGINHLLGVDETREVALAVVQVEGAGAAPVVGLEPLRPLSPQLVMASRVSQKEVDYPAIRDFHEAGMGMAAPTAPLPEMTNHLGLGRPAWQKIGEPSAGIEVMAYPEALFRRRSKRNFIKKRVTKPCMDAFLKALCARDHPGGTDRSSYEECLCVGFLAANVEGMDPGFYLVDPAKSHVGKVKPGAFTEAMTSICLDQAWLAYAGVHFLFMANLDILDRAHGPRGYRYAMMVAGRLGQRLYVAATALGLGCCGIGALYDGEAAELLGLGESSRLLYLVAAGTVKKA